jgi:hypothetical protein
VKKEAPLSPQPTTNEPPIVFTHSQEVQDAIKRKQKSQD